MEVRSMTRIYIKHWSAWTPSIKLRENWQLWAKDQAPESFSDELNISDVPAMLRRRLSHLGKMSIACANDTEQSSPQRPAVFCSRHGELARSVNLLSNLAQGELLSPTHFSLSVHNAIGGMLSINKKDPSNITAIAAAENMVPTALLEASLIMQEQDCEEILCVIYDDLMPEPYSSHSDLPDQAYALALVLTNKPSELALDLAITKDAYNYTEGAQSSNLKIETEPQALTFLRFILTPNKSLSLANPQTSYQLDKVEL